ncbi:ubiquinone biosynthesis protein UbiB [Candidatus Riesia pediculischaeffi]|uniref:Ubiquinone biosynthesis protein UbiB n=2 Tax=Candidatus Riesia pediculischaeffi TaxID=428411 RepID=A0A1V0HJY9_9ENTR|nr:ubiquinone biosynthesis protein UbiB [Candidatus Riesia pediculischaeffi]
MKIKEIRRIFFILKVFLKHRLLGILILKRSKFLSYMIHSKKPIARRICLSFQELGPIWIKLGQFLSTREDLLSKKICKQLSSLQNRVSVFDGKLAKSYIEESLGKKIQEIFADFNEIPLASASISQIHGAILKKNNLSVIIKIIRPEILSTIRTDIKLLFKLSDWINFFKKVKFFDLIELISEYKRTIIKELNLLNESVNTMQLRRNFKNSSMLYIPKIYIEYSRTNVMVAERIYGISISNVKKLKERNLDLKKLAENGVKIFFTQVFRDNFFHADMHPGNILVDDKLSKYIGVDCGIVGSLTKRHRYFLAKNFINFFNRNYRKIAESLIDLSEREDKDESEIYEIELFVRTICEPIFKKPISEISFGKFLLRLFSIFNRFNVKIHPQIVLLQKNLLYVESLGKKLYPNLDLWKTAKPFIEEWLHQQLKISSILNLISREMPELVDRLKNIPELFDKFLKFSNHYMNNLHNNNRLIVHNSKRIDRLIRISKLICYFLILKTSLILILSIYRT